MQIEEPVVLARLPKSLQENSQHKYGSVYGLTAGQKRKRHEVSIAIDGNSVNIYEVEHGNIKTSYAVPPTTSFVCSPSSLRVKTGKHSYTRNTYCATRRPGHQRLEFFEERFDKDQSQGIISSSKAVADVDGDVADLEIMSRPGTPADGQHLLSALYKSGVVRLHTPDLQKEENALRLTELQFDAHCHDILAVRWLTFEDLHNTTFKHRPDLLASINPACIFLSAFYRLKSGLEFSARVGVWPVPLMRTGSVSRTSETAAIVTYSLPDTQLWSQEVNLECSFNPKATSLLVTGVKGVASFDFSSYSPRMTWEQHIPDHGLTSVRINNSFVVTSSTTALTIHDLKFNSSRATLDLARIGIKRKRSEERAANRGFVRIVGYFKELGKLVTVRRNHLLAFTTSGAPKEAMLIDSIGCGVPEPHRSNKKGVDLEIGIVDDLTGLRSEQWTKLHQKMIAAAETSDAAGFEATALRAVEDPDSLDRLSDEQIEFLLSKSFRWADDTATSKRNDIQGRQNLQVALPAFTVLSMLIEHGVVVRHRIQHALRATTQSGEAPPVEAGMIPSALIQADSTLVLLTAFLDNAELLDANELAAIARLLIRLILAATSDDNSRDLQNQHSLESDRMVVDDDIERIHAPESHESNAPDQTSVMRILIVTLEKFACFGTNVLTTGIKSNFEQSETIALVQILRQQLFEGHHTTSIMQGYPSPPLSTHSSLEGRVPVPVLSLDATSKLLLGCIEAIGSLGFLADAGGGDFFARVIPELKSETALATQGLEEASYLCGILREAMRYAESVDKDFLAVTAPFTKDSAPALQKPGTILTLYSEPTSEQGDIETRNGMLPLSLHAENTISLTKMRKGGGQVKDRTLREVRDLESRNKGRYSIERLVL